MLVVVGKRDISELELIVLEGHLVGEFFCLVGNLHRSEETGKCQLEGSTETEVVDVFL
jgi:hypothetical protein